MSVRTWIAKAAEVYCEDTGETVCVFPGVRCDETAPDHANLIAAAPELLAAAKLAQAELAKMGCECDPGNNAEEDCPVCSLSAAIRKAEASL
jgi:hypothetical protein